MVEGKLPGEGLVSFGEEEAEDENDMYVQLAREVLASLEAGQQPNLFEQARELQALFQENQQVEREKNQALGMEDLVEPVVFDPIRVEPVATSDFFAEGTPPVVEGSARLQPLCEEHSTALSETVVKTDTVPGVTEPVMVTVIHTSITTGQDPWAALRAKHLKPRKQRKGVAVYPEMMPDLWTMETPSPLTGMETHQEPLTRQAEDTPTQSALW